MLNVALLVVCAAQVAQSDLGALALQNNAPKQAILPEDAARARQLFELAVREVGEPTTYLTDVVAAMDSNSGHVRQNAFASISIVASGLRNTDTDAARSKLVTLRRSMRPHVLAGLRGSDGVARRYALMALTDLDFGLPEMADTIGIARRLLSTDTEPTVRAAALGLLLDNEKSRARTWTLIEEALKDPSSTVKAVAFQKAAGHGSAEALPYLIKGLHDETDQWTRVTAANALRAFFVTNPEAVDAIKARIAVEPNAYTKELLENILREHRK